MYVHGGMHTLVAARITMDKYKEGKIDKGLYDAKWELPPCKVYIFKQQPHEIKDLIHALGEEDNFDYKLVSLFFHLLCQTTPFYETYRKVRDMFEAEYMEPDDPMQNWRKEVPEGVKLSYTRWKRTLTMKVAPYVN